MDEENERARLAAERLSETVESSSREMVRSLATVADEIKKLAVGDEVIASFSALAAAISEKTSGSLEDMANLVSVIADLGEVAKDLKDYIEPAMKSIKEAFADAKPFSILPEVEKGFDDLVSHISDSKIAKGVKSVTEEIGSAFSEGFGPLKDDFAPLSGIFDLTTKGIGACAVGAGAAAVGLLSLAAAAAEGSVDIQAMCDGALATVGTLTESLPGVAAQMAEVFPAFIAALVEALPALMEAISAAMSTIVAMLPEILPGISEALVEIIGSIAVMIVEYAPSILAAGITLFTSLALAIPKILVKILEKLGALIRDICEHVRGKFESMKTAAEYMFAGFIEGVKSFADRAKNAVVEAVGGVVSKAKSFLGIASPSKVFASIGRYVSVGFANGISDKAGEAVAAMKDMANDVVDAARVKLPAIDVPVGLNVQGLSTAFGGFGFSPAMAGAGVAGAGATNNYYTIEKVDLSGSPVAERAAESLWGDVRRQMRMR